MNAANLNVVKFVIIGFRLSAETQATCDMRYPSDIFIEQYKIAAGEGAVFELKLRLLADKTAQLQQCTHAQRLEDIETKVTEHFAGVLSDEDKCSLGLCRELRNKILHCNFRVAREKLQKMGFEGTEGRVRRIDVRDLSGHQIAEKLSRVAANIEEAEYVSETKTTDPGKLYGWLMEMWSAGEFGQATDAFKKGAGIIDRLVAI